MVKTLSSVHQKVEENHAKWFQKACQIAEKLDITVQKPRTCQVQRNRANNPAETVEEHYRRNLTIPLVDHLINELETRFGSGDQETAVQCLFAVPSMLLASKETWRTSFDRFSTFHEDSLLSPLSLDAEMTLWQRKWERRDTSTVPAIVAATLKEIDSGMYLNITECFKNFFHPASHYMQVRKECVGFEATKNIFTKHDVTDKIDRTCLAAHSLQHGH